MDTSEGWWIGYNVLLADALKSVDWGVVDRLAREVSNLRNRMMYTMGNGGSSAIASHFVVDVMKTAKRGLPAVCLTDNSPLLTALANDHRYEDAMEMALMHHGVEAGDVVLIISSSGNSPNVCNAAKSAVMIGAKLFCLVGFDGGFLQKINPTNTVHVRSHDYGIVEDCHHVIMHQIVRRINTNYGY